MNHPISPLVSVSWLEENSKNKRLIILDASMRGDIEGQPFSMIPSIPNALHFDLKNDFSNHSTPFPNTIPTEKQFSASCEKLGIRNDSIIVIYDNKGIYTSPRAWWLFKTMGHQNVSVLNGGFPAWKANDLPVGNLEINSKANSTYKTSYLATNVSFYKDVVRFSENNDVCILDARSAGRFSGIDEEPRPELKSGAIPNSINLPYTAVLENGFYKSNDDLLSLFRQLNIENKKLIFSCGSGVTACIILLAAELVLKNAKSVYDGSWTEWATLQKLFTA